PRPIWALEASLPFALAGQRIDGLEITAWLRIGKQILTLDAVMRLTRFEVLDGFDRFWLVRHSDVDGVDVSQSCERTVRHGEPIAAAGDVRICRDFDWPIDDLLGWLGPYRAASLEVDSVGPRDFHIIVGGDEFAGRAIEYVKEAVAASLHDDLP